MGRITRRQLVKGAMATTGLALVPDGSRGQAQSGTRLRAFWWGNPDRDKRTKAALDAYKAKAGTEISAEALGWGDYWTKLGTQTRGRQRARSDPDGLPLPLRTRAGRPCCRSTPWRRSRSTCRRSPPPRAIAARSTASSTA